MKKKILNIGGMTCSACSNGLEKYLNKQDGINSAVVNLVMAQASVEYDETKVTNQDLDRFVKEAGFKSLGERVNESSNKKSLIALIIFAFLSIFMMYISMGMMINLPIPSFLDKMVNPVIYTIIQILITITFIIWGKDIIFNGVKNIVHRMPNMDSLVGIGVIVNFIYSLYNSIWIFSGNHMLTSNLYFESSAMIILFIKIGRYIDKKNKAKAVDAIKNLVTITPREGIILKEGKEVSVTINEIQKGDIVVCRPGEKIAVDGVVTKGTTHTDESFLTGESKPVSKNIGSNVLAGSINYDGYIEYEAVNIGKDSSISHIVDLVVEATNTKAPIAKLADKISGHFVPIIFIISILSFILNLAITHEVSQAILALVSVLVVACPCALGLATPLAMVVALGNASKKGIVIKSSSVLEAINKIDTVVMDKTGTITKGELEIVDQEYSKDEDKTQILKLLKSIESKSNHPLAKSICKGEKQLLEVEEFEEVVGLGIQGIINNIKYYAGNRKFVEKLNIENNFKTYEEEYSKKGESIVYFFDSYKILGIFGLRDQIKPDIKDTISKLNEMNKKVIMLSGDNEDTANAIAKEVGIDKVYSNVTPQGKLEKIEELNKGNVVMIGDGINDSPALKKATIGISVSNGTDISSDSADIILLSEDMNKIVEIFNLGSRTIKIIRENLLWALLYNMLMVPIATGLLPFHLNPMTASLAMVLSSITVVLNSLRLRR